MSINLQGIHRTILDHLDGEIAAREGYLQREVQLLEEIESTDGISPRSARKLRQELHEVRDRSSAHEKLLFYLAEVSPLLEEYSRLLDTPIVKRGFMSRKARKTKVSTQQNSDVLRRKNEITVEFLRIAHQYTVNGLVLPSCEIPVENSGSDDVFCEDCSSTNVVINVSDSMACCYDCGYEFSMPMDANETPVTTNTEDSSRSNSRYEAILHFKSSMAKYQGKQQTTIPIGLYRHLHTEFSRAGLLPDFAKDITFDELLQSTQRNTNRDTGVMARLHQPEDTTDQNSSIPPYNGAYSRITHDHIIMFLRKVYEKHYEDVMLIHYSLTGVSPPNIGHLEPILEQDFRELMALYHQEYVIKRNPVLEDGKSFKSNYYILYKLLQKHNVRCNRRHFSNMLKTPDREIFYDMVCKDLFGKLNWKFHSEF